MHGHHVLGESPVGAEATKRRLPRVSVAVDEARQNDPVGRVDHFRVRRVDPRTDLDDHAVFNEYVTPVEISDIDARDVPEVDGKLVKLARQSNSPIITNDFNLNRVAELQGVLVLNINELANALKPLVLPGEDMAVRIIQEGKEFNQGVGYLDDGTMIVVENGRQFLHQDMDIVVTRVLQTVAGRMIFAQPKESMRE